MFVEVERIENAKEVMNKLSHGVNPLNGENIEVDNLLNDARLTRCFYFVTEVLDNVLKGNFNNRNKLMPFIITPEQKGKVVISEGKIGVNEFSRCINACLNLSESKRWTGVELNKKLRKLGVLGEENTEAGKIRTVINDKSAEYGFEKERKSYNGVEYDMVVINSTGKKYLLENIESIMAVEI